MTLASVFNTFWPNFCSDVGLDKALASEVGAIAAPLRVEDVEELLETAFDRFHAETGAPGTELAALMLVRLVTDRGAPAAVVAEQAVARLRAPEVLEDLALDCPKAPQLLMNLSASLQLAQSLPLEEGVSRRLRVLAVRNGFDPASPAAKALRQACDLRIPGSPYIAETGNEDAGGVGEQEMIGILQEHLVAQPVDVVVAQSRGCRLLAQLISGDAPCWAGSVLALSPAGEWGTVLAADGRAGALLIAVSGDDLVELGGAHPVLMRSDFDAMAAAAAAAEPPPRALVFEEDRRGGWADAIAMLVQRVASM